MKLALFLAVGLLVLPPVAKAQVELGFDSGLTVQRILGTNLTTFSIPATWLRVGFFPGPDHRLRVACHGRCSERLWPDGDLYQIPARGRV